MLEPPRHPYLVVRLSHDAANDSIGCDEGAGAGGAESKSSDGRLHDNACLVVLCFGTTVKVTRVRSR